MTENNNKILLVEGDIDFKEPIEKLLKNEKYDVISALNLKDGVKLLEKEFDIAIFDTNLSDGNGIELLSNFKGKYKKPAILLTVKNSVDDRIEALNNDADYYLPKPVIFNELLAVIRNLLKKYNVQSNYWVLDSSNVSITDPTNKTFKLTNTELNIFKIIVSNNENYISREEIFQVLEKKSTSTTDRSGDMLISRIRKKIDSGNRNKKIFNSIRGKGYKFTPLIKLI